MNNNNSPLVSVGIPTYNRPESLRRTLECITRQTYPNLEIIVSDNCSPDTRVQEIITEFAKNDSRVINIQQAENIGAGNNFKFVLSKATGTYFMWAADDDKWKDTFIENIVQFYQAADKEYVGVITEGQYMGENENLYKFFKEGAPFYEFYSKDKMSRLKHMLQHNYGNLVYAIFRTEIIQKSNIIFAYNEIPFLLQVAEQGNIRVLPQVGFFKRSPSYVTYLEAKWEKKGGTLPVLHRTFKQIRSDFFYHFTAFRNIKSAISQLCIPSFSKAVLRSLSAFYLLQHFINLVLGFKLKKNNG